MVARGRISYLFNIPCISADAYFVSAIAYQLDITTLDTGHNTHTDLGNVLPCSIVNRVRVLVDRQHRPQGKHTNPWVEVVLVEPGEYARERGGGGHVQNSAKIVRDDITGHVKNELLAGLKAHEST